MYNKVRNAKFHIFYSSINAGFLIFGLLFGYGYYTHIVMCLLFKLFDTFYTRDNFFEDVTAFYHHIVIVISCFGILMFGFNIVKPFTLYIGLFEITSIPLNICRITNCDTSGNVFIIAFVMSRIFIWSPF